MTFSDREVREIATLSKDRGMIPIPEGTPARFLQMICEKRAKILGYSPSAAPVLRSQNEPADDRRERLAAISLF